MSMTFVDWLNERVISYFDPTARILPFRMATLWARELKESIVRTLAFTRTMSAFV
jgi:hypothetical protein